DSVTPDGDLGGRGIGRVASAHQPVGKPRHAKVVTGRRLVVDDRNRAGRAGAERVLHGAVGEAARTDGNVLRGLVRVALDLVERPGVRTVERARRAVSCSAGRVGGLGDVTGPVST